MAFENIKVEGLDQLARALQELPANIGKNALRGAVNAGATVVRKEVALRAPERTGRLKKAIYQKQIREASGPTKQTFYVGIREGKAQQNVKRGKKTLNLDAFYWRFLEFGTKNITARPFVRPAFDAQKEAAVAAISAYLDRRIQDEATKQSTRK